MASDKKRTITVIPPSVDTYMKSKCARLRARAKAAGIAYDLSWQYLRDLYAAQDGKCAYTGMSMALDKTDMEPECLSVDKIDPRQGYVMSNIVLCTAFANTLKGSKSAETFQANLLQYVSAIMNHLQRLDVR